MKKIMQVTVMVLLAVMTTAVRAQNVVGDDPIVSIFRKYEDREGVESIRITPAMFKLMTNGKAGDRKTDELLQKITGLRILTVAGRAGCGSCVNRREVEEEMQGALKAGFEEIVTVKSAGDNVALYVGSGKATQGSLLFMVFETESLTLMHLTGTIDRSVIDSVMSGEIGISGKEKGK